MGHYLKTTNPEAAEAADHPPVEGKVIPGIGDTVEFFPRPGELRPGRGRHAAIVTGENEDGTLDLVVMFDFDDLVGQRKVPRRSLDGGMGWEPRRNAGVAPASPAPAAPASPAAPMIEGAQSLTSRIDQLEQRLDLVTKALFGDLQMPDGESVLGVLAEHDDAIATHTAKLNEIAPAVVPVKRKPGKGAKK